MTPRQVALINRLHSIGAKVSESSERDPLMKSAMVEYHEFKSALESYFANRVNEIDG